MGKFHEFSGLGMPEGQAVRPQGNVAIVGVQAVFSVTHQGQIAAGKLAADLVGSSCMKPNHYPAQIAIVFQAFVTITSGRKAVRS